MGFYPLLEQIIRGREAKTVRDELVSRYPEKYGTHSTGNRVKNIKNVSSQEFRDDIVEVSNDLELEIKQTEIIPPGRGANPKAQSDSFETIHVTVADPTKKDFGIILASLAGRTKTSTVFKEGMVCFFFSNPNDYESFSKSTLDKEENYFALIESIINDIEQYGIQGLSDKDVKEIKEFLKGKLDRYDLNILNSIFNSMSIGNWLRTSQFGGWIADREKLFTDLKKTGSKISKVPEDKWNPMDIVLIDADASDEIESIIKEAKNTQNKDKALGIINQIFADTLHTKNPDSIALAISLKEAEAQAGKAKSYVDNLEIPEDLEYNLTEEEKNWAGDDEKILEEITKIREEIEGSLDENIFDYKADGPSDGFQGKNLLGKYGALKMLYFFIDQSDQDGGLFLDLASYGLSLGVNPTFFKFVGNIEGNPDRVEKDIMEFPALGGVTLYDNDDGSYDGKIWIKDGNNNSGVQLIYWVEFSGWVYYVQIQIRSNQPVHKIAQVTVEIEKFKKLKNLSEEE